MGNKICCEETRTKPGVIGDNVEEPIKKEDVVIEPVH